VDKQLEIVDTSHGGRWPGRRLRVALIGAARSRNGTGPFVSRILREQECDVWEIPKGDLPAWETGARSVEGDVDAVAICSPANTHLQYLKAALHRGNHVFCEKPIIWDDSANSASILAAIDEIFTFRRRQKLVIHENTQWRYVWSEFLRLAGGLIDPSAVTYFKSEFCPNVSWPHEMIRESGPHANSLLQQLGCNGIRDLGVSFNRERTELVVSFVTSGWSRKHISVEYNFRQQTDQPRNAAFYLDGLQVIRKVRNPGYEMSLCIGVRECALPDPLAMSVSSFLQKIRTNSQDEQDKDDLQIRDNLAMCLTLRDAVLHFGCNNAQFPCQAL